MPFEFNDLDNYSKTFRILSLTIHIFGALSKSCLHGNSLPTSKFTLQGELPPATPLVVFITPKKKSQFNGGTLHSNVHVFLRNA